MRYAILDIETTGGKYNQEGITEIAIYQFDGHQVTDRLISLVNPEREIQEFVVRLTGINSKMLRNAPKFYEIAKRIIEITQDCILVAHNAGFDYRILRTEFRRLGYDYQRKTLCSVELSQKLIPNKKSYSLGKLVRSLGIPVSDHHRANGDAMATLELFKLLLEKDTQKDIIKQAIKSDSENQLSKKLLQIIDELPSKIGIYYIYDRNGNILYIGKNKNIKKRVNTHFLSKSSTDKQIQKQVSNVTYELTGNLLIAQLKEEKEIKESNPKYQKKRPKSTIKYALYSKEDTKGYLNFYIDKFNYQNQAIATFENLHQAKNMLYQITEEFRLCPKLTTLSQAKKNCYNYQIQKCNGACIKKESVQTYNERAKQVEEKYGFAKNSVAIVFEGRNKVEKSFLLIEQGILKGYGFAELNYQLSKLNILQDLLIPLEDSTKNRHLIQKYTRNHPYKKVIIKS